MSLDVYLEGEPYSVKCQCRECDNEHFRVTKDCFFEANITHNLNKMADAAGIYKAVWRPEELGLTKAGEIVQLLREGIEKLEAEPERFKQFEPSNKWGTYDDFVPWLKDYLEACEKYPDATIRISR